MIAKFLAILLVGLVFEAIGVVCLDQGLRQIGEVRKFSVPEVFRVVRGGVTNSRILLGVLFEAVFFVSLLVIMSKGGEVSFLWPLTALGLVFTTLAAKFVLHENVSLVRWGGVVLIVVGAALVTYGEKKPPQKTGPPSEAGPP